MLASLLLAVTTPADPAAVPERFRLAPATFQVSLAAKHDLPHSGVAVFDISFPSPVVSPHPENNTVVGELFVPMTAKAKMPAVLVLDIMDGAQVVSRGQAMWLAGQGIVALTLRMAYYGPRRPPNTRLKMLSPDIALSVANVTQTVLDCRRGLAYLAGRDDVDTTRIGVLGTSLGSFVGGLVAASDPHVSRAVLMLGGGNLVESFYDHPKAKAFAAFNDLIGGSRAKMKTLIDPVDPITYATELKKRKLLLIAAKNDDIVPPKAMTALWEACDKPEILWLDANHVGAALFAVPSMTAAVAHFTR